MEAGQSCGRFHLSCSQISPCPTIECFRVFSNGVLWSLLACKQQSWFTNYFSVAVIKHCDQRNLVKVGVTWPCSCREGVYSGGDPGLEDSRRPEQESKRSHLELQTRGGEFKNSQTLTQWHASFNMAVLPHNLSKQSQQPEIKQAWSHGGEEYFSLRSTPSSLCLHGPLATS